MNNPNFKEVPPIDRFSAGCTSKILRVSHKTLVRWDKSRFFVAQRSPSGARIYTRQQIENFMLSTYVIKRKDGFLEYRPHDPVTE